MPTTQTRVNLTLPDEVVRVLDRLAKVSGTGRATVIREWLIEGLPQFADLASAMELASQKNLDAFKIVGNTLRELGSQIDQTQLDLKVHRRAAMRKVHRD